MRLPEVLSKAPNTSDAQVENFLGYRKVGWGQYKTIREGVITRNYFCLTCGDVRTYISGRSLSCLVTGDRSVSIDATLRCAVCDASTEAWFLVGCEGDLFAQAPVVHLERFTENRRDVARSVGYGAAQIDDLFERAQIAFDDRLGAGAMIYLRKIFEMVTSQAAEATGIATKGPKGGRRDFRTLLKDVDAHSHIIPPEFSNNGYKLFSELSEAIHGYSDELDALSKYKPCCSLVFGIVDNIRNNQQMAQAIVSLGWNQAAPLIAVEGAIS